ncbi:MAG TPA: hypothetical protein VFC87_02365 [Perlabentimonas sp.]|nr:hypothetical protein [Bacteroidales bacterium]MDD4673259.1 hypothetical protein [Bacteroidales bacterium]MDY0348067.1 hypothetical protein [Tenuifilaceae bacterium]HZJ73626.1 hypothetical protein [Perlabentimonas sp.]
MAKGKQTISDIQKALLSSTRYIKDEKADVSASRQPTKKQEATKPEVNIDPLVMRKIRILAPYEGETTDELINKALNHYLRLKSLQLEKAIEKLTKE